MKKAFFQYIPGFLKYYFTFGVVFFLKVYIKRKKQKMIFHPNIFENNPLNLNLEYQRMI